MTEHPDRFFDVRTMMWRSWRTALMLVSLIEQQDDAGIAMAARRVVMRTIVAVGLLSIWIHPTLWAQQATATDPVQEYVDEALDIMQEWSLRRDSLDWRQIRARTHGLAAEAVSTEETYPAIRQALQALGDNHSFLRLPQATIERSGVRPATASTVSPTSRRIGSDIALVRVPAFSGPDLEAFATLIDRRIVEADGPSICGWMVDLRGNGGGNMWPMLAGLRAILGPAPLGAFRLPTGIGDSWTYSVESPGTPLHRENPPVAVLTDSRTASSGEAVVIAFHGRPDTRFFGEPTAGRSTANRGFPLRDGALLVVTVATMLDRDGREYAGRIEPDVLVPAEAAEARAVEWLRARCSRP
jgi:hypothetical protein